jgi:hypothetical protein
MILPNVSYLRFFITLIENLDILKDEFNLK